MLVIRLDNKRFFRTVTEATDCLFREGGLDEGPNAQVITRPNFVGLFLAGGKGSVVKKCAHWCACFSALLAAFFLSPLSLS